MNARLLGAALAMVGVVVFATPIGGAAGQLARGALNPFESPTPGPPRPGPALPTLTPAERSAALGVVAKDDRLQDILAGHAYTVDDKIGPWTTLRQTKIGASMVLELAQPLSIPMRKWPAIDYDLTEASDPPYREFELEESARNVTNLLVRVDLTRLKVVSIGPVPGPGSSTALSPDAPRIESRDSND